MPSDIFICNAFFLIPRFRARVSKGKSINQFFFFLKKKKIYVRRESSASLLPDFPLALSQLFRNIRLPVTTNKSPRHPGPPSEVRARAGETAVHPECPAESSSERRLPASAPAIRLLARPARGGILTSWIRSLASTVKSGWLERDGPAETDPRSFLHPLQLRPGLASRMRCPS